MEKIGIEEGKEIIDNFFKVGNYYRFDRNNGKFEAKYIRLDKITHAYGDRVYLKGTGFTTLNGRILNPTISKDEILLYIWVGEYINKHIIKITKEDIIRDFDKAAQNLKEYLFDI